MLPDMRRSRRVWTTGIVLILAGGLGIPIRADQPAQSEERQAPPHSSGVVSTTPITPTEGLSTLHHLGLNIEQSSMGWAGQWSASPSIGPAGPDGNATSEPVGGPFILTGADLYRVSCRSCHKPDGTGAPPEVNSLVGPVHAASAQWMTADMRARGRNLGAAFIRQLTTANEADLRARLRQGGHNMPAFGQISDQEYSVLRPYLDALAGVQVPKARPRTISEPADRVGELIVKGTCHICHDATEHAHQPTTVLSGVIPSLGSLPHEKTFADFVHKVREGAQVPLSAGGVPSRGRMPVFDYLTEPEVASAYSYLTRYPPR